MQARTHGATQPPESSQFQRFKKLTAKKFALQQSFLRVAALPYQEVRNCCPEANWRSILVAVQPMWITSQIPDRCQGQ
jgi:hypothetical protein